MQTDLGLARRFSDRARTWLAAGLVTLALAGTWLGATASATQTPRAPLPAPMNVVLLIIDDVRWDSIGAAGSKIVRTPRVDRLAAEGVRFRQGRVTTSICMVSRATLLTGQYMSRHGITAFGKALTPDAFANTFPGTLRRAGYWTGHVGKYDVGAPRPEDYDFLRAYHGTHWIENADGTRIHVTEKNARDSLDFLRARPKDRPFVLTVGFFAAHAQDNAKEQYLPQDWSAKFYEGITIPPPLRGDPKYQRALPPFLSDEANEGRVRFHWRFDTPENYQAYMKRYYRLITEVDDAIGRLVDELKAQGVYDNTLIVFIGDNGYFHADRGLADKWYPYEESDRVPLIVRDPRLPAGRRGMIRDEFALNLDVAPTIIGAAGLAIPPGMQGQNLAPLYLATKPPAWRDEFFYEHPTITRKERIPSSQGVIRRDWKFIDWPEYGYQQLFDLRSDPGEIRNLIDQPAQQRTARRMQQSLDAWRARVR
ncbi:MAG: sulfatase-like hydrolase/transferase [Acidobacteriota bacterium]